ncbi:MAG: N-acetyltransferase [Anaerolineaceae bacterium]|nr:N-acetyltransferase [Anaerolineaceae bacterium]
MTLIVRPESALDYPVVAAIHRVAFGGGGEVNLVAAVRQSENYIPALSLVAVLDEQVVGHILFSRCHIQGAERTVPALALAPLAMLPAYQNQAVGTALMWEGLNACRQKRHEIVIVLGHPDYYTRFGFVPASTAGIHAPFPLEDDAAFMAQGLTPGVLDGVSGMVQYPPHFDGV